MVTPKKKWGQNFLHDNTVINQLMQTMGITREDFILEIGPGCGALTKHLVAATTHVRAIEIDPACCALLQKKYPQLAIERGDIRQFCWSSLDRPHRIVGNLPYYLSSYLLTLFCDHHQIIEDIHIMLQKEVAQRIESQTGDPHFGRLSLLVSSCFEVTHVLDVPSHCFTPAPQIDSCFVHLKRRTSPQMLDHTTQKIIKEAFHQRRKTIRNSLSSFFKEEDFEVMKISSQKRAQDISRETYQMMSAYYKKICKK